MKLLLIGEQQSISLITHVIYDSAWISSVLVWEDTIRLKTLSSSLLAGYDYIVLAFSDRTTGPHITQFLSEEYGISPAAIIDFYMIYDSLVPIMKVDRVMKNPLYSSYDGLILGLSHTQFGILPNIMPKRFANLSVSSQDLYYDLKTLEYCIENYPEKIRNLNYIMIDMLDYSYFNYDISLGRIAYSYYYGTNNGFLLDGHNFDCNKNFSFTFEEVKTDILCKYYQGVDGEHIQIYGSLFQDPHAYTHYRDYTSVHEKLYQRTNMITDEDIASFALKSSIVQTVHPDTLAENKDIFYRLLKCIYMLNPDMKVFLLIIPRYAEIQEKTAPAYRQWKDLFYETVDSAKRQFPFTLLDLNDHEISKKRIYYQDLCHLNYFGALKLTEYLVQFL